jgi:transcriptional regulator with XRE-family HTH domain
MPVMTRTPKGDEIVILSRAEYDALTTGRSDEDAADVAHANRILAELAEGSETVLTSEQADELLAAKTPLAFWRKHRGLTQEALSKLVGVAQGFISEIENGSKTGDVQTLAALARALEISLDDLVIPKPPRFSGAKSRTIAIKARRGDRMKARSAKRNPKSRSASARG